jgi:hypothetical protein
VKRVVLKVLQDLRSGILLVFVKPVEVAAAENPAAFADELPGRTIMHRPAPIVLGADDLSRRAPKSTVEALGLVSSQCAQLQSYSGAGAILISETNARQL